jgi:uncharacterized membrane protein YjgN (DUF898 family)
MPWPCPECGSENHDASSRCLCGNDLNRPRQNEADGAYGDAPGTAGQHAPGEHTDASARALPLAFHGSAREYFRVWIVNLCLTLLTCGIFSAWAKVRKKRYFYSHTTLDGTPFQYLGQPGPILKGRMIAAVLFLAYYASRTFFTSFLPYFLAVGAMIAPWVIIRSAAFNARYSAFRNMTFGFDGGYLTALGTLYAWGIIPAFLAGMIFDWWGKPAAAAGVVILFGLTFPWWICRLRNFLIEHTSFGGRSGVFGATGGQFFKIYFVSGLIIAAVVACIGIVFGTFAAKASAGVPGSPVILNLIMGLFYAGYVLAYAYVRAHSSNLVWNHTLLGPISFRSTLRGLGLAKLYIVNALGIVVSLGMLTPWAAIRTLRYRVDHLQVFQHGELTSFQGSTSDAVQAAGAETLDLFDMDLSL